MLGRGVGGFGCSERGFAEGGFAGGGFLGFVGFGVGMFVVLIFTKKARNVIL
jgi:hypothetical protein